MNLQIFVSLLDVEII